MSIDLDDLARLEAAATKGPWSAAPDPDGPSSIMCEGPAHMNLIGEVGPANADFIVAIRNAAPALITAAREAERMRAVVEAAERRATEAEAMVATLRGVLADIVKADDRMQRMLQSIDGDLAFKNRHTPEGAARKARAVFALSASSDLAARHDRRGDAK